MIRSKVSMHRYGLFLAAAVAMAAPCTTATPECWNRVEIVDGRHLGVYSSTPVAQLDPRLERVFILVHGTQRNATDYFVTAVHAAQEAGALERTLVIAPAFRGNDGSRCKDSLEKDELAFECNSWKDGRLARNGHADSFSAMDRLLELVDLQPGLKEIVVAGHSAGGQYVQRYAAANRAEPKLKHKVRYVVANPSSYLYLETWRPEASPCPGYNKYKYGLSSLTGYAKQVGAEALRTQYLQRDVTYLLGERDFTDEHNLDKSCEAMAQGPNRLARGLAYFERLTATYQAPHKLVKVPGCDHNADCMYRSETARAVVFR